MVLNLSKNTFMKAAKITAFLIIALIAGIVCIHPLHAQGFYVGGSIGPSFVNKSLQDVQGNPFDINKNSFGYKIFTGYSFNVLGLEAGYHNLGQVKTTENQTAVESKSSGWDICVRGHGNVGPLILFAKAGGFFSKSKNSIDAFDFKNNNSSFMWGLGAALKLSQLLMVRAEWEALDMKSENKLSSLTLGAAFHIGGNEKN